MVRPWEIGLPGFTIASPSLVNQSVHMETRFGPMTYRVDADAARGTVDYWFDAAAGESVLPTRVVPHARGATFMFTITRAPGSSEEDWQHGRIGLDEELTHLKAKLEIAA